jgi:hypothetical protein
MADTGTKMSKSGSLEAEEEFREEMGQRKRGAAQTSKTNNRI